MARNIWLHEHADEVHHNEELYIGTFYVSLASNLRFDS